MSGACTWRSTGSAPDSPRSRSPEPARPMSARAAFRPRERLLLRLVDELHDTAEVSDTLWQQLRAEWTEEQLVELVVLVGRYHLISFVTNAFRIPHEPYGVPFPGTIDRASR